MMGTKSMMPDGVWPTMVTPYTASNEIDYASLNKMVEWFIERNVHGLFAVCQSSEMFYLSLDERIALARYVKEQAAGRIPVIASGHISDKLDDQVEEIRQIYDTGIDAFVLVSNRLAAADEDDEVWKRNAERLLERLPDVSFGIYECPYPYKRLLSPELLKWCADSGRFMFLKDTSCDMSQIRAKLAAVEGTPLKLYNANSTTLLESLRHGAAGFSGVMANFHPELYVWLADHWKEYPEKAQQLQNFLGVASFSELQYYPVNAKYHFQLSGIYQSIHSRAKDAALFRDNQKLEIRQLRELTDMIYTKVIVTNPFV